MIENVVEWLKSNILHVSMSVFEVCCLNILTYAFIQLVLCEDKNTKKKNSSEPVFIMCILNWQ